MKLTHKGALPTALRYYSSSGFTLCYGSETSVGTMTSEENKWKEQHFSWVIQWSYYCASWDQIAIAFEYTGMYCTFLVKKKKNTSEVFSIVVERFLASRWSSWYTKASNIINSFIFYLWQIPHKSGLTKPHQVCWLGIFSPPKEFTGLKPILWEMPLPSLLLWG